MNPAWVSAAIALAVAIGGLSWWFMRVMWRVITKTEAFLEDWNGRPMSPGHPRRPGVLERLEELESSTTGMNGRFDSQDKALADIKQEVMYNSGHSLKDAVTEVKDKVRDIVVRLDKFDPPTPVGKS